MSADPQGPVTVATVRNDVEAAAIISALADHGIEASATGGYTAGFRAEAPGDVTVVVRREHAAAAKKILQGLRGDQKIDWSEVDVGKADPPQHEE